jgi:hypothetical protein
VKYSLYFSSADFALIGNGIARSLIAYRKKRLIAPETVNPSSSNRISASCFTLKRTPSDLISEIVKKYKLPAD